VLFVAAVIDDFQGFFLADQVAVHHIPDLPIPFTVLAVPLALTHGPLLQRTRFTDTTFDDFPSQAVLRVYLLFAKQITNFQQVGDTRACPGYTLPLTIDVLYIGFNGRESSGRSLSPCLTIPRTRGALTPTESDRTVNCSNASNVSCSHWFSGRHPEGGSSHQL